LEVPRHSLGHLWWAHHFADFWPLSSRAVMSVLLSSVPHPMWVQMLTSLYTQQSQLTMYSAKLLSWEENNSTLVKQTFLTTTSMQWFMDKFWFTWYWTCISSWRSQCQP
jgi:hypothetical protein